MSPTCQASWNGMHGSTGRARMQDPRVTVSALFDAPLEAPAQAAGEAAVECAGPAPNPAAVDCGDGAVP